MSLHAMKMAKDALEKMQDYANAPLAILRPESRVEKALAELTAAISQAEAGDKPVGWMDCFGNVNREKFRGFTIPLYRTPPTHTAAVQEIFQWLMGANGEFPHREQGEGAYWWRKELRRRLEAIGIDAATPPRDKES